MSRVVNFHQTECNVPDITENPTDLVENLAELVDALAHGHRAVLAVVEHAPDGAAHPLHVHGAHLDTEVHSTISNFSNLEI